MGTLLPYARRTSRRPERSRPANSEGATIIIFPGVRYERTAPEPTGKATRTGHPGMGWKTAP